VRGIDPRFTLAAAGELRNFRKPVLLAWATEDTLFPIAQDQPERLADLITTFACQRAALSA